MTTNPATLARLAACYTGIANKKAVQILELAAWANVDGETPPVEFLDSNGLRQGKMTIQSQTPAAPPSG